MEFSLAETGVDFEKPGEKISRFKTDIGNAYKVTASRDHKSNVVLEQNMNCTFVVDEFGILSHEYSQPALYQDPLFYGTTVVNNSDLEANLTFKTKNSKGEAYDGIESKPKYSFSSAEYEFKVAQHSQITVPVRKAFTADEQSSYQAKFENVSRWSPTTNFSRLYPTRELHSLDIDYHQEDQAVLNLGCKGAVYDIKIDPKGKLGVDVLAGGADSKDLMPLKFDPSVCYAMKTSGNQWEVSTQTSDDKFLLFMNDTTDLITIHLTFVVGKNKYSLDPINLRQGTYQQKSLDALLKENFNPLIYYPSDDSSKSRNVMEMIKETPVTLETRIERLKIPKLV